MPMLKKERVRPSEGYILLHEYVMVPTTNWRRLLYSTCTAFPISLAAMPLLPPLFKCSVSRGIQYQPSTMCWKYSMEPFIQPCVHITCCSTLQKIISSRIFDIQRKKKQLPLKCNLIYCAKHMVSCAKRAQGLCHQTSVLFRFYISLNESKMN